MCLTIDSGTAAFRMSLSPYPPYVDALNGIGPLTALLGPGGKVCGEIMAGDTGRIVGAATAPVLFSLDGINEDYNRVTNAWVAPTPATTIDQVATGNRKPVIEIEACAQNVSSVPVLLRLELFAV